MSNETENQEPVEEQVAKEGQTAETQTADATASAAEAPAGNEWQAKHDELKDKYVRLFADFDNYKKRVARERLELIKDASKDVILNLLPVLDDFAVLMLAVADLGQRLFKLLRAVTEQQCRHALAAGGVDRADPTRRH